jgi:hypothetical protein
MNAITIQLPWAAAIRATAWDPTTKLVENRGRAVAAHHIGKPVAIHAGAGWDKAGAADPRIRNWWYGHDAQRTLSATDFSRAFRKVLAVATLVDCHRANVAINPNVNCCSPWGDSFYGQGLAWHLVLADVVDLAEPVETRGYLPVPWTLPDDVAARVQAQLPEVAS